jgi:hypothetical protein
MTGASAAVRAMTARRGDGEVLSLQELHQMQPRLESTTAVGKR